MIPPTGLASHGCDAYVCRMNATRRRTAATYQLNRAVVDQLAAKAGVTRADDIASLLGIDRSSYFRLLSGSVPLLDTALEMAARAEVPVTVLFQRQSA